MRIGHLTSRTTSRKTGNSVILRQQEVVKSVLGALATKKTGKPIPITVIGDSQVRKFLWTAGLSLCVHKPLETMLLYGKH
jgi:hypothetical protein